MARWKQVFLIALGAASLAITSCGIAAEAAVALA